MTPITPAWQKWHNCCDHLWTLLAPLPTDVRRAVCHAPAVCAAETRAAELARSGDALATNAACNVWLRCVKAALASLTAQEAA